MENRRCWFQRAAQKEAGFRSCWSLHGEGRQLVPNGVQPVWTGFHFFFLVLWRVDVLLLIFFECGGSRCGLGRGASGSGSVTGLHAMGCVFSLPEHKRDAPERSVKVSDVLLRPRGSL